MPRRIKFTLQQDETIRRMCAERANWDSIGNAVGCSDMCAKKRADQLRISKVHARSKASAIDSTSLPYPINRAALPAGDAMTWGLIMPGVEFPDYVRKDSE